jgi:hypothetical protein
LQPGSETERERHPRFACHSVALPIYPRLASAYASARFRLVAIPVIDVTRDHITSVLIAIAGTLEFQPRRPLPEKLKPRPLARSAIR